jgi:hypothetical protein
MANYTHRVALSNRRRVALDKDRQTVTFTYRDYRHGAQVKTLTLSAVEFIRRADAQPRRRTDASGDFGPRR